MLTNYPRKAPDFHTRTINLRRLYCTTRKAYVHLSGRGFVKGTAYAWAGTAQEARNLIRGNSDLVGCILVRPREAYQPQLDGIQIANITA